MPKFRVTEGTHQDENGRVYRKGEEVESPHDLAATFRGKFVPVDPGAYKGPDRLAPISASPRSAPGFLDDPAQRQKSAEPVAAGGAPPGELPPPTPTEQLGEGRGSAANPSGADAGPPYSQESNDEPADEPAGSDASGKPGEPEGTDVTDRFPKAKEQDYRVYKRTRFAAPDSGPFFVYDADDLARPVGHGLKRTEVDGVVEKAIKSE